MTTIGDAVVTEINDHYNDSGGGGTKPSVIANIVDYRTDKVTRDTTDSIIVEFNTSRREQVTTEYADVTSILTITVITSVSDNRLKEICDEVRWVMDNCAITGVTSQSVINERDVSERARKVYAYEMTAQLIENLASSSAAYSGTPVTETPFVMRDGTKALTANWDAGAFEIRALTLQSDQATGTAPFTVASETLVSHLNSDFLDGNHAAAFATPASVATAISDHNVADAHVLHSTVSISAGSGLSGGGTIASNRTISLSHLGIQSLTDPGADRIMFWDESAPDATGWLTPNTGMAIDGTNLNCSISQYSDSMAKAACVSDAVYAAGWDTVTDVAPSKNAVYDKISVLDGYLNQAVLSTSGPTFDHLHITTGPNAMTGAMTGVTSLTMSGALSGLTTFSAGTATFEVDANGYITTYPGMGAGTDNFVLTYDNGTGLIGLEVSAGGGAHTHDGDTLQLDGINSNGGAFSFSTTGAVTYNQQSIFTHATAGMLDLNPSNTGTQNVIDITPSAALAAGSTWKGIYQNLTALDPATGAACTIYGVQVDASGINSADDDAVVEGFSFNPSQYDVSVGASCYHTQALAATQTQYGFLSSSSAALALGVSAQYYGLMVAWSGWTRTGNAPKLDGINVQLPGSYTNFGTCRAGYFSGGGSTVELCDGTYAVDVSGATNIVGAVTGVTSLTLSGAIATATNISMTGELDMTGSGALMDLNPAGTGSANIIDITPSAALAAGSTWKGLNVVGTALTPATGSASTVYGIYLDFSSMGVANTPNSSILQVYGPANSAATTERCGYFSGYGKGPVTIVNDTWDILTTNASKFATPIVVADAGASGAGHGNIATYSTSIICLAMADHVSTHDSTCSGSGSVSVHQGYYTHAWAASSPSMKDNIIDADSAELERQFDSLRVRSFTWNHENKLDGEGKTVFGKTNVGVISTEVPEFVVGRDDDDNPTAVNFDAIDMLLVAKVKALEARIAKLEAA